MKKNGLDEMQKQRRNKIGNDSFMLILYLLLLDAGLNGFGFRWVSYPAGNIIILTLCAGLYFVRLVLSESYVGPSKENERSFLKTATILGVSMLVATSALYIGKKIGFASDSSFDELAVPIMFIIAVSGVLIAAVVALIKRRQNRDE